MKRAKRRSGLFYLVNKVHRLRSKTCRGVQQAAAAAAALELAMATHDRPQTVKSILINLWSIVSERSVLPSFCQPVPRETLVDVVATRLARAFRSSRCNCPLIATRVSAWHHGAFLGCDTAIFVLFACPKLDMQGRRSRPLVAFQCTILNTFTSRGSRAMLHTVLELCVEAPKRRQNAEDEYGNEY